MQHGVEFAAVVVICFTLVAGATLEWICKRLRLPYTIAMLATGLGVGVVLSQLPKSAVTEALAAGASISPGLIIFVFLPVLVFESAFALEVHAFRKNVGAVLVLAIPALLIATGATGALLVGVTGPVWAWGWLPALVFGALISATDPVAVVALLRGLGAPKRLGLLIEGESLLNDGTAIVVFTVLLELLTGQATFDPGGTALSFIWVAGGGLLVGLGLAIAVSAALARTFNQPLVEITLTLALAYSAMLVAESLLHVSGVIAVVAAGLWMAGPGRVNVSPEVTHFLHRFWEMLAHLANTLIFFLVGLLIASQVDGITWPDLVLVAVVYLGVMMLRGAIVFAARPVMNRVASTISTGDAAVMAWGGLRGAVSLALALIVSQHPAVDPAMRRQFLVLTAGVVLLTITVNGGTMGALLRRFGFDKAPPGDRLAEHNTRAWVLEQVHARIEDIRRERDLRTVDWREVTTSLADDRKRLEGDIASTQEEILGRGPEQVAEGLWRRALSVERAAYWNAFSTGTLGPRAARLLDHEVDLQLDRLAAGDREPPSRRTLGAGPAPGGAWKRLSGLLPDREMGLLEMRFDLLRGEALAARRVLDALESLADVDAEALAPIRDAYRRYRHQSTDDLEDMRSNLPEVTGVIETRIAQRIALNFERDSYERLAHDGTIAPGAAATALEDVETKMAQLRRQPARLALPETAELCRDAPLFKHLDEEALAELAALTRERALTPGETLFKQGDPGDSMFVIARGAVGIYVEEGGDEPTLLDTLGGGDIIGEMALLMEAPRNATVIARTTVTLGEITRQDLEALMSDHPSLDEGIWHAFARRRFENYATCSPRFDGLDPASIREWSELAELQVVNDGGTIEPPPAGMLFVVTGALRDSDVRLEAPASVPRDWDATLVAEGCTRVMRLPERAAESIGVLRRGRMAS